MTARSTHLGMTPTTARRALAAGLVLALIGALVLALSWRSASGADEYPLVVEVGEDDPRSLTCEDIGALLLDEGLVPALPSWQSLKIEDPPAGQETTVTEGGLTVTITNVTDTTFDWSSNVGVDLVYVKSGSQGSTLYLYDPPTEATSGTGLASPQAISHITFCWDADDATTTTTTEGSTTTTEGSTTTTEGSTTTTEGSTTTTEGSTTTTEGSTTTTDGSTTTTGVVSPSSVTVPETTTTGAVAGSSTTVRPATTVAAEVPPAEVLGWSEERGELPRTGLAAGGLLLVAGGLLAVGGALSIAGHRRSTT